MDKEIKKEARKQYLHYFRIWFVVIGILAAVFLAVMVIHMGKSGRTRANNAAPAWRVYDEADVLTDEEERKLEEYIALCENKYHFDIVLVTVNEDVESQGYWDTVMMNLADDFYDYNNFGYDKVHGDGVLLLDNWYEDENGSQKGSWLSTCGSVYEHFSSYDIDKVLDAVYYKVDSSPYLAYKAYVDKTCELMESNFRRGIPWGIIIFMPLIVAIVYAVTNLKQVPAKDTTTAAVYVSGGKPVVNQQSDDFIRKHVATRHINTTSSGGGHRSGGGGSHRSSSGVRHGGGGRRR